MSNSDWQIADKTALITGATSGIGETTALALARAGARVILHGRNAEKLALTRERIMAETGNSRIETIRADFSALADVRAMADEALARFERLDVLINNAGGTFYKKSLSADEYEKTFAVNHLAPFLLTNLLLERLKASAPARIIVLSSMIHAYAGANMRRPGGWPYLFFIAYGRSKLANLLFTRELALRLKGSGVTVNAVHPGIVRSKVYHTGNRAFDRIIHGLLGNVLTPEEGARTPYYLAASPDVADITGEYFIDERIAPSSRASRDMKRAADLWRLSEEMTGLA